MDERSTENILKSHGLSLTEARIGILSLFRSSKGALAHANIEKGPLAKLDRVTIYRTLQTFVDKGILHTVPTNDNSIVYALCPGSCSKDHHRHDHVHFVCNSCETTFCLEKTTIPDVALPDGFMIAEAALVVKGTCNVCQPVLD